MQIAVACIGFGDHDDKIILLRYGQFDRIDIERNLGPCGERTGENTKNQANPNTEEDDEEDKTIFHVENSNMLHGPEQWDYWGDGVILLFTLRFHK